MNMLTAWTLRIAQNPPMWLRVGMCVLPFPLGYVMAQERGVALGVVAFSVFAVLMFPQAISPGRVATWTARHPILDGMIFAPLLFLCLALWTTWPWWACLMVGIAGYAVLMIATLGRRRHRLSA